MYNILRIVSLVLFFGGLIAAPFLGLYTMFFLPFVGIVGYLVALVGEPEKYLYHPDWIVVYLSLDGEERVLWFDSFREALDHTGDDASIIYWAPTYFTD